MRAFLMATIVLGLSVGLTRAGDKVTEKDLVGKWSMKLVGGKKADKSNQTIEFTADGNFVKTNNGKTSEEGSYKIDGTRLLFKRKGEMLPYEQKDLSMKDGKVSWRVTNTLRHELTRIAKDKDK
jgi:uncharacterized protein (TIGR03066 family)